MKAWSCLRFQIPVQVSSSKTITIIRSFKACQSIHAEDPATAQYHSPFPKPPIPEPSTQRNPPPPQPKPSQSFKKDEPSAQQPRPFRDPFLLALLRQLQRLPSPKRSPETTPSPHSLNSRPIVFDFDLPPVPGPCAEDLIHPHHT
jgi:hypothetical protein